MAKQSDFGTVDPGSIPSLAFYIGGLYKVRRYTNGSAPDGRTDGQTNIGTARTDGRTDELGGPSPARERSRWSTGATSKTLLVNS